MSAFQVQQLKTLSLLNPLLAQTSRLDHQARNPRTRTRRCWDQAISSFFYRMSECEKQFLMSVQYNLFTIILYSGDFRS